MNKTLVCGIALVLIGCGGGGGGGTVKRDLAGPKDMAGSGGGDLTMEVDLAQGGNNCAVPGDYGSLGPLTGATDQGTDGDGNEYIAWQGEISGDPDVLSLELYAGYGGLQASSNVEPGTYKIEGDDLNYGTCGVCVLVYADIDSQGAPAEVYLATAGTVTVTSVSGNLKATIDGARFEKVTIDPNDYTSTPVGDGCVSGLTGASIDEALP